jgi:putative phosphoesterase
MTDQMSIGVISDTHGYLDPLVASVFAGVRCIIHAGDTIDPDTLTVLESIAPVTAVAGNMDAGKLSRLPREVAGKVGGLRFVVGHKRKRLLKRLALGKIDGVSREDPPHIVVFGHDHVPAIEWVDGILYLNPGTASSPHEEDDDPTVAVVTMEETGLSVRFVMLRRITAGVSG